MEAIAVENGIPLARDMKILQVFIELDAESTVNSINERFIDGNLGNLYQGILSLLNCFTSWKIKHGKRQYNRAAHELARLVRNEEAS